MKSSEPEPETPEPSPPNQVMKMMGQNSMHNPGLQDLLRGQRHNKVYLAE